MLQKKSSGIDFWVLNPAQAQCNHFSQDSHWIQSSLFLLEMSGHCRAPQVSHSVSDSSDEFSNCCNSEPCRRVHSLVSPPSRRFRRLCMCGHLTASTFLGFFDPTGSHLVSCTITPLEELKGMMAWNEA